MARDTEKEFTDGRMERLTMEIGEMIA